MFFPFFVTLEFAFYVGWLKVAETLINPFGEDDDDFELNRLLDRHIQVGYMICDPTVQKPDLLKDKFWESVIPKEMLYSVGSDGYGKILSPEFRGSAEVALDDKLEGSETGYGETTHLGTSEEVSELMRRRISNTTLYESIRTQGRVSRYVEFFFVYMSVECVHLQGLLWQRPDQKCADPSTAEQGLLDTASNTSKTQGGLGQTQGGKDWSGERCLGFIWRIWCWSELQGWSRQG